MSNLTIFKVGVVNVSEREGGRRTFVDNFYEALKREGYDVCLIDLDKISMEVLNSFDILHFSAHFWGRHMWKVLLATHPKKLLTIHGWVKKENLYTLKQAGLSLSALLRELIYSLLSLLFLRTAPLFFDATTCPSRKTSEENGLSNAIIISNAIFPEHFEDIREIDLRKSQDEILFVTYVSIGGLKNVAITRTMDVVEGLNEVLEGKKATLLVFGKDYLGKHRSPSVHFMGFSDRFLGILKSSDLFITGKTFPDIGYVEMQAGILGIPVAKFTEDYDSEEIVDGQTGILAESNDEMVLKLLNYVSDLENKKQTLGSNF